MSQEPIIDGLLSAFIKSYTRDNENTLAWLQMETSHTSS